jgi:tripartite-type tricarboxylate transporter receptor subunit TctC
MLSRSHAVGALSLVLASAIAAPSQASDFTKPINLYVGGGSGGGIDIVARLLARHMDAHVPGKPKIIVSEMPGAGGIRLVSFLAMQAPKDGTALGAIAGGPVLEPLIGARHPGYNMSQFTWIGAISRDSGVCVTRKDSKIKTLEDARREVTMVAGTGAGSDTDTYPLLLNKMLSTKIKVISGYKGSRETILAMENGEVDGRCSFVLSGMKVARPDWLKPGGANLLLQLGLERDPALPDTPGIMELVKDVEDRQMLELMMAPQQVARPIIGPPGMEADRSQALRAAFDATMADAGFLEDAKKLQLDVAPTKGAEAEAYIRKVYATPPAVVDRLKKLIN